MFLLFVGVFPAFAISLRRAGIHRKNIGFFELFRGPAPTRLLRAIWDSAAGRGITRKQ